MLSCGANLPETDGQELIWLLSDALVYVSSETLALIPKRYNLSNRLIVSDLPALV